MTLTKTTVPISVVTGRGRKTIKNDPSLHSALGEALERGQEKQNLPFVESLVDW